MKKLSFSLVMIFMFFSAAFAQDLPRIAVYVIGDMPDNNKRVFGPELLTSLVNSGRYSGMERPNVFFAEVESKRTTEFGGAINDSQLSELGKEFGVDYVCIADVVPAFGIYRIEVRIVDAKTAQTVVVGESNSSLKTFDELTRVLRAIVRNMFGEQAALVRESESVPVAYAPEPSAVNRASGVAIAPTPSPIAVAPAAAPQAVWPPKAAVYVTGLNPPMLSNALSKAVTSALMKANIYEGIERIDQHITGAPNDVQIIQAGKKAGVHFVFVVNVSGQINVRIIDVDLATEMAKVSLDGKINSPIDAGRVAVSIVNFILKSSPKPPPGYTPPAASATSQKMSEEYKSLHEQRAPSGADIYFAAKLTPLVLPNRGPKLNTLIYNLELGAVWKEGTSLGVEIGWSYYDHHHEGMVGLNLGNVYELSPQLKLVYGSFFGFCALQYFERNYYDDDYYYYYYNSEYYYDDYYFYYLGPYIGLRLNNFEFTNRFLIGSGVGYMVTFGFHFGGSKRFRREAKPQNRNSNFYQDFHD